MHPLVQICSLVLLIAAAGADHSLSGQVPNKIADISPYKWAVHDWVPERNRRTDDRSMPIGAGELEPVPQKDKLQPENKPMHKSRKHNSGKIKLMRKSRKHNSGKVKKMHRSRKQNSGKVKDVLKRHILKSYQNVRCKGQNSPCQRRNFDNANLQKHKNVPLLPKDFEGRTLQLQNKEEQERLQYKGDLYLPIYKNVLDKLKAYKKLQARRKMFKDIEKQQETATP